MIWVMGGFCTLRGSWNRMFVTLVERLVGDGYKKCAIAERIGMSPQRLSKVLNGNGTVSEKALEKLVEAFGLGRVELVLKDSSDRYERERKRLSAMGDRCFSSTDELFELW